jgi:hypothetical protein
MAIFSAESRCSPDDNAPWFDGSDPLPAAVKFFVSVGIPLAWAAHHLSAFKQDPFHPDAPKMPRHPRGKRLGPPQFAADDQILGRVNSPRGGA